MDSPAPVILLCPVCATAHDTDSAQAEHECVQCGQTWAMQIDLQRIAEHSI